MKRNVSRETEAFVGDTDCQVADASSNMAVAIFSQFVSVNKKDRHDGVGLFYLARLKEFESPTFRLGGGCSILLSYKRISHTIVYSHFPGLSMGDCRSTIDKRGGEGI